MTLNNEETIQIFCAALQGAIIADAQSGIPQPVRLIVNKAMAIAREAMAAIKSQDSL